MKLTILAATGGVGRHLLRQAVAAGHDVTVVVRNPARLPATDARVVVTDLAVADPALLRGAIVGADAVLSGLGARSGAEAGVASRGTRAVVEAMRETGVRRIVVISAASVGTVPSPGRPDPPRLLEVRLRRRYRTAVGRNVRGGAFIARADVAHHMLDVLDRPETFHRDIGIAY